MGGAAKQMELVPVATAGFHSYCVSLVDRFGRFSYDLRHLFIQKVFSVFYRTIPYDRESIDFKQILERRARNDEDAGLVAEWIGRVLGYMIRVFFFPGLKAAKTTIS